MLIEPCRCTLAPVRLTGFTTCQTRSTVRRGLAPIRVLRTQTQIRSGSEVVGRPLGRPSTGANAPCAPRRPGAGGKSPSSGTVVGSCSSTKASLGQLYQSLPRVLRETQLLDLGLKLRQRPIAAQVAVDPGRCRGVDEVFGIGIDGFECFGQLVDAAQTVLLVIVLGQPELGERDDLCVDGLASLGLPTRLCLQR
jgi:hypothetical protein